MVEAALSYVSMEESEPLAVMEAAVRCTMQKERGPRMLVDIGSRILERKADPVDQHMQKREAEPRMLRREADRRMLVKEIGLRMRGRKAGPGILLRRVGLRMATGEMAVAVNE